MHRPLIALLALLIVALALPAARAQDEFADPEQRQQLFEQVFGDLVRLDPAAIEKIKAARPGTRIRNDRDGDGRNDEVWFIDTSMRHRSGRLPLDEMSPIVVRAIDEDGDMGEGEPDRDSDLYVVDWKGDGVVDAVVDYTDHDGDQDLDEMGMYFYQRPRGDGKPGLRIWWGRDDGDDNLLWNENAYRYYQRPGQEFSHFNGDETFFAYIIHPGEKQWTPFFENPFLFWDHDGDGASEEVMRVSGGGNDVVHSLRWSFDADNSATRDNPRDYDVSISALAPGWTPEDSWPKPNDDGTTRPARNNFDSTLKFSDDYAERIVIRGIPTGPMLHRDKAAGLMRPITWARVLFTWVENDQNIAWNRGEGESSERWEGVLNQRSDYPRFQMPAVGGPSVGPFNNRNELLMAPSGPNQYYFNPADGRVHIRCIDTDYRAWTDVDYNLDNKTDMFYEFFDTNRDGYFDRVTIDADGDGEVDDFYDVDTSNVRPVVWDWNDVVAAWQPTVANEPAKLYALAQVLQAAVKKAGAAEGSDPVWELLAGGFKGEGFPEEFAKKFAGSDTAALYYLQLYRDRAIVALKAATESEGEFWKNIDTLRGRGDTAAITAAVRKQFEVPAPAQKYAAFVKKLRAEPKRPRVAWDNKWYPPNWGWESEKIAYRAYDGHFDFFGKNRDVLIYTGLINTGQSYHLEADWGIDALHVGRTGGLGGVVLYVNGEAYPVYNDGNTTHTFNNQLVEQTDDKVTLEMRIEKVGPAEAPYTVRIRPSALAGKVWSPIEVLAEGGRPGDKLETGLTLNHLVIEDFLFNSSTGVMGLWGWQEPGISWIGTGVIFPAERFVRIDDQPEEHRVVLRAEPGEPIHYAIQADWLNGRQYPVQPSPMVWLEKLNESAAEIRLMNMGE